jgi:hypothetical protein
LTDPRHAALVIRAGGCRRRHRAEHAAGAETTLTPIALPWVA